MTVTAFGPFGPFRTNPSEVLGRYLYGDGLIVIPVTFAAVDYFVENLPESTERLLMLGVARNSTHMRIERFGSDFVGSTPDISGELRSTELATRLEGTLFTGLQACDWCLDSDDAGNYLCNYLYYQVMKRHPNVMTGFVHVPPFSAVPFALQAVRLKRLINSL